MSTFLFLDGQQAGPFTAGQLREMWKVGKVTSETLYWREGAADWLPLSRILHELEEVSAPPPMPQPLPPPMPPASKPKPPKKKSGCLGTTVKLVLLFFAICIVMAIFLPKTPPATKPQSRTAASDLLGVETQQAKILPKTPSGSSSGKAANEGAGVETQQAKNETVAMEPGATPPTAKPQPGPEELTVAEIASDRSLWPKALTLKESASFAIDAHGSIKIPAGETLELVAVTSDGMVELARQNLRSKVSAEKTDLISAATDIQAKVAELRAVADARKAVEDAKPRPSLEEANGFYGLTEQNVRDRMGQPIKVSSGTGPEGAYTILGYSDTKDRETFFSIDATGRVGDGQLRGVDFNKLTVEEQQTKKEIGEKPLSSGWDGSVIPVQRYLKDNLKDPKSLEFIEWSDVYLLTMPTGKAWAVRVKYRAKNSFGGYAIENQVAIIRHDKVVEMVPYK